jgi:hypothetical protein
MPQHHQPRQALPMAVLHIKQSAIYNNSPIRKEEQIMFDLNDPHWRRFAQKHLDSLGVTPNALWFNSETKEGALVVAKSSKWEEYALSKAGLDYLRAAIQDKKITDGFVVLADWNAGNLVVVANKSVTEVTELDGMRPRNGPFGKYWWVRSDLGMPF